MMLSVVIPVYNGEQYLPACLDSLQQQLCQPDEIIVVDDGSTDRTQEILADYVSRMPTMRVIRQQNQGVSVARNLGFDQARGKYLSFLDADDFFHPTMLMRMLDMAEPQALDMVVCNVLEFYGSDEANRVLFKETDDQSRVSGAEWLCTRLKNQNMFHGVCMHLYRRDFLLNARLRFVPDMRYEDVIWTTRALIKAERIGFIAQPLYYYRYHERPKGDVAAQVAALERVVWSSVANARTLASIAADPTTDDQARYWIRWQLVDGGFSVFHRIDQLPDSQARTRMKKQVKAQGYWALLWRNAADWRQRRKIISRYFKYAI